MFLSIFTEKFMQLVLEETLKPQMIERSEMKDTLQPLIVQICTWAAKHKVHSWHQLITKANLLFFQFLCASGKLSPKIPNAISFEHKAQKRNWNGLDELMTTDLVVQLPNPCTYPVLHKYILRLETLSCSIDMVQLLYFKDLLHLYS